MDAYPRSHRIWPHLLVVLVLFVLAAAVSDWRPVGRFIAARWAAGTPIHRWVRPSERRDKSAAELLRPEPLKLRPSVAQRVAVHPEAGVRHSMDATAMQSWPVVSEPFDQGSLPSHDLTTRVSESRGAIGPILPPGSQLTSGNPLYLEIPSSDLTNLSQSLPSRAAAPTDAASAVDDNYLAAFQSWPDATALQQALNELESGAPQLSAWTGQVRSQLNQLHGLAQLEDSAAAAILGRLERLAADGEPLEANLPELNQAQLRRVCYAVQRRCAVWRPVHTLAVEQASAPLYVNVLDAVPVLKEVERRLADHPQRESWHNFLMLAKLQKIANESWVTDATVRRETARSVLRRLAAKDFTEEQRQIVSDRAIGQLQYTLQRWAEQPIDLTHLLLTIEQFELTRAAAYAMPLISQLEALRYSRQPSATVLAQAINTHYRNANVRISISGQLLNSLLPAVQPVQRRIRETILGASVVGQNQTSADLRVQLIDDNRQLRLRLLADGRSQSRTVSSKGPVRFHSRTQAQFEAGKDLLVSVDGVFVTRSTASAHGNSRLLDIETDYDQIPLLGWILRQMALDEHQSHRSQARAEAERRIERHAKQEMDESVHTRLTGVEEKVNRALLQPLRRLQLDPTAMEMRTVADRLVMRFRLAAVDQLAAYTPRPRALPDNLISLQLHESAANNLLEQLDLEDERVELEQLMQELSSKLKLERRDIHEEIPEGVIVRLAAERPIQFEFNDDRVVVVVRIQELTTPKRTWRNLVVRGRYRADVERTHVDLQREGGIELISEQVGFRDQVALRGIFTKVMTRNHRLNIFRGQIQSDTRLRTVGVTQFVARDGWIGVSVGRLTRDRVAGQPDPSLR
jgi:hypothetical protein